jgi:hypothetical protein
MNFCAPPLGSLNNLPITKWKILNIVYHCETKNCYERSWILFIVVKPRIVMKDLEYLLSSLWNQELLWKILNIVYHCETKNCYERSWISFIIVVKPRIVMKDLEYHLSLWNQELLWKILNIVYRCETKKNLGYQKVKLKDLDWTCFTTFNFLTFPM